MNSGLNIKEIIESFRNLKHQNDVDNKYNTVVNHTRMEQLIYSDKKKKLDELYSGIDYTIDGIETEGQNKLETFPYISQDLFNLFYKLNPLLREEENLKDNVKRFNKQIVEKIIDNPDYTSLKLLTEGKDYESIEGTREFIKYLYDNLDQFLNDISGDRGILNNLDKSQKALESKTEQLEHAIQVYEEMIIKGKSKEEIKSIENQVKALDLQIKGINKKIKGFEDNINSSLYKNKEIIEKNIDRGLKKALDKVHDIKDTLDSWGGGDDHPDTIEGKIDLVQKVKSNSKFKEMAKYIGRMRRLAKSKMNSSFVKGRGQKVGIEYGNDIDKILTSEYALLTTPETEVLFYKNYAENRLKQYKEVEKISKGRGNIIFIGDESSSIRGKEYWLKALAIALMDIAISDNRNFVYIPFGRKVGKVIEVNKESYSEYKALDIATNFMNSGDTQFTPPIEKAMEYLRKDQFENADVIFATDGHSDIDTYILKEFNEYRQAHKTKCVGILLNKGGYGNVSDYTLKQFTDHIFKTSELTEEDIALELLGGVL